MHSWLWSRSWQALRSRRFGRSIRSGKILDIYAICKTCAQSVSCGGKNAKTFNTSNLVQHLKSKHQDDYKEFEKHKALKAEQADQANEPCTAMKRQLSLEESGKLVRLWDINNSRAQRVHCRVGEMIAIDCQPFSVVEDVGFTRLLKQLEPRYSLPSRDNRSDCRA